MSSVWYGGQSVWGSHQFHRIHWFRAKKSDWRGRLVVRKACGRSSRVSIWLQSSSQVGHGTPPWQACQPARSWPHLLAAPLPQFRKYDPKVQRVGHDGPEERSALNAKAKTQRPALDSKTIERTRGQEKVQGQPTEGARTAYRSDRDAIHVSLPEQHRQSNAGVPTYVHPAALAKPIFTLVVPKQRT